MPKTASRNPSDRIDLAEPGSSGSTPTIGIIGAGFSGVMAALHILRVENGPSVVLVDSRAPFGCGTAYSTANPDHVLNVRAGNMSAWPDRPRHFVEWLAAETGEAPRDDMFATRGDYGRYLQSLLSEAVALAGPGRLRLVNDAVVDARRSGASWSIDLDTGRSVNVGAIIVAIGNPPPTPPRTASPALLASHRYIGNPWSCPPDAGDVTSPILMIGTGLTMVDVALAAAQSAPYRPLIALSRRGLLPRAHSGPPKHGLPAPPQDASPSRLTAWLKEASKANGWRSAVDSLRPYTQSIWSGWSQNERASFLRHGRAYWDVHRHRLSPQIAARMEGLLASGRLTIKTGRIQCLEINNDQVICRFRPKGAPDIQVIEAGAVINCTGPSTDLGLSGDRLLKRLRERGEIRADALGLGVDADADGRLIADDGRPQSTLMGLGPVTRGALWEIVAVPDIRLQAPRVAAQAVAALA